GPVRDARIAVHRDGLRVELDVALVGRHARPVFADARTALLRRVERHLLITGVLCKELRRALRIALLPRLAVTGEPSLELRVAELRVRARRDGEKNRGHRDESEERCRHWDPRIVSKRRPRSWRLIARSRAAAQRSRALTRRREEVARVTTQAVIQ